MNDASIILAAALGLVLTAGAIVRDTRYRIAMGRDISLLIPSSVDTGSVFALALPIAQERGGDDGMVMLTERPTATMTAHERRR